MTSTDQASQISSRSPSELNPQMLVLAREYSGFTQTALAKKLGVSQGTVSKIEEGLISAGEELVDKLVSTFERPHSFFFQNPGYPLTLEGNFRKKSSLTKKLLKMADARMNIERLQINKLVDGCSLDFSDVPVCDPDEYLGGAKEIARVMRSHLEVSSGAINDLVSVVEGAGCIVRFIDFGTLKIDGFAVLSGTNIPIIFVNKAFPADRRRLTIAHEFGHVIMHRGLVRPNMEDEAFAFAGEFLMPENEIKSSLYPLNIEKLARLKLKWKVSMAAILQHAKRMGAVNDRYFRYMRSQLSKNGYTKEEPYEANIDYEKPRLLTSVFKYYKDDLEYSIEDVSDLIFATHEEIRSLARPSHDRFTVV